MESVEHHVAEEEGEMFPKVREVFDERELQQLSQRHTTARSSLGKATSVGFLLLVCLIL
jgi:hypothetical protein